MRSNKRFSRRVARGITDTAIKEFLASLNTPRSLSVWLLYDAGEHDQLTQLVINPLHYEDHHAFRDDYAATSLLAKSDFLSTSFNREQVALSKFQESEERCRATNDRTVNYAESGRFPPEALHALIPRVQRKIASILGSFDAEEFLDCCDWGPGVSTLLKGPHSVKPNKYQSETGMTHEVFNVMWPLVREAYPAWWLEILAKADVSIEAGNVVTTVPKNSKTDRVIAVEPGWNLWFQKGLGTMIRRRLLRVGCNLNDQSFNQWYSKIAFEKGLATIDFSGASDSIAFEVVRLLIPGGWFRVLDLFRCKRGRLPGTTAHTYWEKFSSMGNGFTFELESLIFYAIALVVTESTGENVSDVSVFGDDVILPSKSASAFTELSELLGFVINRSKSFTSGPFYESCGAHWFRGHDVKPFYLDEMVDSVVKCYGLHNNIVEFAHRCLDQNYGLDGRFKAVAKFLRSSVQADDLNFVPRHFGDVGFCSNLDQALMLKTTSVKRQVGYKIRIRTEVAVTLHFDGYGLVLDRVHDALCRREDRDGLYYSWHDLSYADRAHVASALLKRGIGTCLPSLDVAHKLRVTAWLQRQTFGEAAVTKPIGEDLPPLARSNLTPLKTLTKTVRLYTTVGYGRWYDFGPWI